MKDDEVQENIRQIMRDVRRLQKRAASPSLSSVGRYLNGVSVQLDNFTTASGSVDTAASESAVHDEHRHLSGGPTNAPADRGPGYPPTPKGMVDVLITLPERYGSIGLWSSPIEEDRGRTRHVKLPWAATIDNLMHPFIFKDTNRTQFAIADLEAHNLLCGKQDQPMLLGSC